MNSSAGVIILLASSCSLVVLVAIILGLFFSHKNGSLKSGLLDSVFGKPEEKKETPS